MVSLFITFLLFIALSGVLAAVDAALLSVTRPEIAEMVGQGKWGAHRLRSLRRTLTRAVVVIVILTNTVNVLGPVLVTQAAAAAYGPEAIVLTVVLLTLCTIIFSEIIPKALGAHRSPLISRLAAPPIQTISIMLYPIVRTLEGLANLLKRGTRPIGTEDQIRALVTIGRRAGHIEGDEMRMIHRAFVLNDRTAADIMTPVKDVAALPASATAREALTEMRPHDFSRYPVYGKDMNDILGLVLARDILKALADGNDETPVITLSQPALTVAKDCAADELLIQFRDKHLHLAVVQDEEAHTIGVATLEDVLEQLVGEIDDEKDVLRQG